MIRSVVLLGSWLGCEPGWAEDKNMDRDKVWTVIESAIVLLKETSKAVERVYQHRNRQPAPEPEIQLTVINGGRRILRVPLSKPRP